MTRAALHALAARAGLAQSWCDADGITRQVSDDSLRAILAALGLPADTPRAIADSDAALADRAARPPVMLTVDTHTPLALPHHLRNALIVKDDGPNRDTICDTDCDSLQRSGLPEPGYYRLEAKGVQPVQLAVAPRRCPAIRRRGWGVAIQIPSLRGTGPFGDFAALAHAVRQLGEQGADAVAISPVHALADPARFAPYSPSSRLSLNTLFGAVPDEQASLDDGGDLIDWAHAGPARIAALSASAPNEAALQAHARQGLEAVQQAARASGMAIGIVTDLAVGVDPRGADVASDPAAFLAGLTIGAPPDPLGPQGQDWGLTSYAPQPLLDRGFAPFIALLRANIPQGGGIRIDHGFGLQRLWVVPEGRPARDGAYLAYPFADLLRLVKLEAWRADAIVIAEDLGTRPPGFAAALEDTGIHGMAVLPFSREADGAFTPAAAYPATSVAMTGTHDTPTLAGWWTGRDLAWNRRLNRGGESEAERALARIALWDAIGDGAPIPAPDDPAPVIDRAVAFLAESPAPLLIVPMEDMIGALEQPNLPGTIDEHPNWRRRLPDSVSALLSRPDVQRRIAILNRERGQ